jgi:hypothetical protein
MILKVNIYNMHKLIKRWVYSTNEIMKSFLIKYFELEDGELYKSDYFWVADEIGGICNFGDYYINFSDMVFCLSNDVPIDKFFEWYDWCLESNKSVNLKSFLMGVSKEIEKKDLDLLRLKVEQAEQELKEALKRYGDNSKE